MFKTLLLVIGFILATVLAQDGQEVIRFAFKFGFFADDLTPDTEVIKEDVEGVLCQTQYFLSRLVQNATGLKSVHAEATEINWGYYEGENLPAHINFTVEFSDAMAEGDANWLDDQILIDEMEALGEAGLQKFITDWIWEAEPKGLNFFNNANKMSFDGVKRSRVEGDLPSAECPETGAPTMTPTTSPAPTGAPTIPAPASTNDEAGSDGAGAGGSPEGGNAGPDAAAGRPILPSNGQENWPFGNNYNDAGDLGPMVDFSLKFHMFKDHEKSPTEDEVNSLLCEVNEFFTEELRKKLEDSTIYSKATYINWYFDESGAGKKEDIVLNFTAFAYKADEAHTQISANDVFDSMKLSPGEIDILVENYIWKSEPETLNLFAHTEQLFVDLEVGDDLDTEAMMIEADGCVFPDPPAAGTGTENPSSGNDEAGSNPTDENFGLGGDAKGSQVRVSFRVSNIENIKDPTAVKAEGLDASFPVFSNEVVNEIAKKDAESRRILVGGRRLRVVAVPGTQQVDNVVEYPCPSNAIKGATCHSASATYDVLMSSDEDQVSVQNAYTDATQTAVDDGTYNNVLQRVDPETPLYIGIMTDKEQVPPGSRNRGFDGEEDEDDGWFKWWYLLILLLLLLLCCFICLYCWMLPNRDPPPKEGIYEEREVVVEEFEDEGDDPRGDEEFVEDDGSGAIVPYGQTPAPAPTAQAPDGGAMVSYSYDPDSKYAKDRAQRNAILGE